MAAVTISRSDRPGKKWKAVVGSRAVHFGARGYEDYTMHKDKARMQRYITRHRAREDWKRSGIFKAGFWSRWILWNKPSLRASVADTKRRFKFQNLKLIL